MPATIRTELKDNSKEWGDGLKRQFSEAKTSAASVSKSFESVGQSLDLKQPEQYQGALQQVTVQLDRASPTAQHLATSLISATDATSDQRSELHKLDEAARQAAQNVGSLDNQVADLTQEMDASRPANFKKQIDEVAVAARNGAEQTETFASSWTNCASKLSVATQVFDVAKQGATAVGIAITALSAVGVPAFQKLTAAGDRVKDAFIKIGESPAVQRFASMVAQDLEEKAIPAITSLAGVVNQLGNSFEDTSISVGIATVKWQEYLGLASKGMADHYQVANKYRQLSREYTDKSIEEQNAKRQKERERQKREMLDDFADPGQAMRKEAAKNDRIAKFDTTEAIDNEIDYEKKRQSARIKLIKEDDGNFETDRHVLAGQELLIQLEQRRLEIIEQVRAEEKAAAEERQAAIEEEKESDRAREELDQVAEKYDKFQSIKQAVKSVEELTKHAKKLTDLQEEIATAEDKYLEKLKGPEREAAEKRIKFLRDIRDQQAENAKAELAQIEAAALSRKAAHDKEMLDQQEKQNKFREFVAQATAGRQHDPVMAIMNSVFGGEPGQSAGAPVMQGSGGGFNPGMMQGGGEDAEFGQAGVAQIQQFQNGILLLKKAESDAVRKWNKRDQSRDKFKQTDDGKMIEDNRNRRTALNQHQMNAQIARQEKYVKKQARRQMWKKMTKGKVSPTDIAAAQNNAMDQITEGFSKQKDVTAEQKKIFETNVELWKKNNSEIAAMKEGMQSIVHGMLNLLNGRGQVPEPNNVKKAQNTN